MLAELLACGLSNLLVLGMAVYIFYFGKKHAPDLGGGQKLGRIAVAMLLPGLMMLSTLV